MDVCVPSLDPLSERFLRNVEENLPVNRVLTSSLRGRGRARQDLIDRVETDYFAFVDTDVILLSNWFDTVRGSMGPGVGAVEGAATQTADIHLDRLNSSLGRLNLLLGRRRTLEEANRAFTGATLVRTSAVSGIRIPDINYYEDEYIRRYIVSRGLLWKKTRERNFAHLRGARPERFYDAARCGYYIGYFKPSDQVRRLFFTTPPKALFALFATRDPYASLIEVRRQVDTVRGVLHARSQGYRGAPPGQT